MIAQATAEDVAQIIKSYMNGNSTPIEQLRGPYIVRGILIDHPTQPDVLEVGVSDSWKYKPVVKLNLTPPRVENGKDSYMEKTFAGNGFSLTEEQFEEIKSVVEGIN